MFDDEIFIKLTIDRFRVGAGSSSLFVELPLAAAKKGTSPYLQPFFQLYTSSFRGLLRSSFVRVISHKNEVDISTVEKHPIITSLFGSWITEDTAEKKEGKLTIFFEDYEPKSLIKKVLKGIRIDPYFGVVKHQALFSYEFVYPLTDEIPSFTRLTFKIEPKFPLTDEEVVYLFAALNGLRWESFGGFKSRGLGTIYDVSIENHDFVKHAKEHFDAVFEM